MAWVYLAVAGALEIVWAIALKQSDGFSRLWPSVTFFVGLAASMLLLALSVRTLPIGTAYAVWTGIGAAGTAIVAMIALGEERDPLRIACVFLIVAGIVGLKLRSS